ncbi:hypothetical protein PFISCL1PPCAC_185, partial [Pristionchus fissidentatus]
QLSSSCTVLSAEPRFQLESINLGPMTSIDITNTGYDTPDMFMEKYNIMTVDRKSDGSSVNVFGPIATLWNGGRASSTFTFAIRKLARTLKLDYASKVLNPFLAYVG